MKSFQKILAEVSDLAAVAKLTHAGTVSVDVMAYGTSIQIEHYEVPRIAKLFKVPKSRMDFRTSEDGDIHCSFAARGVTWCSCILAHNAEALYREIEGRNPPRLGNVPRAIEQKQLLLESKPPRLGMLASELQGIE